MSSAWGEDDDRRRRDQRRRRTMAGFAYDVSVNVLANLLAAGIVALALDVGGVIRLDPTFALFLVFALAVAALLIYAPVLGVRLWRVRRSPKDWDREMRRYELVFRIFAAVMILIYIISDLVT